MNFIGAKKKVIVLICIAAGIVGLSGFPAETQSIDQTADEELLTRVQSAFDSDPYFYDKHVTVTMQKGQVILTGVVSSESDLMGALRIARKAAGQNRVLDGLSIEAGGRH
jgi:osmotically-inducible protein OsmY